MTDQPARVTPAEISDLLDQARQMISGGASLDEQIAYHERKALLLSRVAADLDTAEAHQVAAGPGATSGPWPPAATPPRRRR
jgi:hypothetical protein